MNQNRYMGNVSTVNIIMLKHLAQPKCRGLHLNGNTISAMY